MRRQRVAFLAAATLLLLVADTTYAQVYKGVVLDEATREPVPFVTVSLQNKDNEHVRHTSTNEEGTFLLVAPDVTEYFLHVKRIGYSENTGGPFLVEVDDTLSVQFRIMETTESLGEITVEGTPYEQILIENYLKSKNFYTRKNQGIGQFMTRKEIEEKKAVQMAALFRGMHGVRASVTPFGETVISSSRRSCSPNIILNGHSLNFSAPLVLEGTGQVGSPVIIERYANLENLVGVEFYSGIVGQPAEFGPKSYCGAVVLWTW